MQTKGCRPSSTGTTSEVVMDIPNQTYGQAHWLSRSKSRLVTNRGYDCDMIGYILGQPAGSIHVDVYSPASW